MKFIIRDLITFFLFVSCNGYHSHLNAQNLNQTISLQKLDTLEVKPYSVTAKPEIFETAFFNRTEVKVNDTVLLKFYAVDIGNIDLKTGKVVACDPSMTYLQRPFTTQFPLGTFPVQLAIARVYNNQLVGYSRLLFSQEPVVKWEFALKEGQHPMSIFGDSSYFYAVDGGLGQFMDESSFNKLKSLNEGMQLEISDSLSAELDKNTRPSWQFANTTIKSIAIVAFTSGFGDGRYSTFIGYDKNDKPCRLLTDFELVDWTKK